MKAVKKITSSLIFFNFFRALPDRKKFGVAPEGENSLRVRSRKEPVLRTCKIEKAAGASVTEQLKHPKLR
jgi:hypothetical protein